MSTRNTHTCMSGIGSAHSGWHETEHYVVKTADWASKLGVKHTGGRGRRDDSSCGGIQRSAACRSWSGDAELIQNRLRTSRAHVNQPVQIKLSDKSYNATCLLDDKTQTVLVYAYTGCAWLTWPEKWSCGLFDRPLVAGCRIGHKPRPLHVNEWYWSQNKKINYTSNTIFRKMVLVI